VPKLTFSLYGLAILFKQYIDERQIFYGVFQFANIVNMNHDTMAGG